MIEMFGCQFIKKERVLYKIFERGRDRIDKEMDILWIIQRLRKLKILSNLMNQDMKFKSKFLLINDSNSDI